MYSQATARIPLDELVSYKFPINREVKQGDPNSTKLFPAVMEEIFKKADTSEGINLYEEHLTNLTFADGVALFKEETKQTESQ